MKTKLLLFFLFTAFLGYTQTPWRAKIFVHFLDSNNQIVTDTVWFGCDSLGDVGYQPGLDVIDTSLQWNKVYSADDLVKAQFNTGCANLKTNIREFRPQPMDIIKFQFYTTGQPISMSWDTMDFIYQIDSTYRISGIFITAKSGYIYAIDAQEYIMGGDWYTKINNEMIYRGFSFNMPDSIQIIPESFVQGCGGLTFSFELRAGMGWLKQTGLYRIFLTEQFTTYPNPFNDKLFIESNVNRRKYYYSIVSLQGLEQTHGIIHSNKHEIDTRQLVSGIYFIQIYEGNTLISKPYKIIKL